MEDMVNHPPHYTQHPSGIECIEVIEHFPANIALAIKHLWRFGRKEVVDKNDPYQDYRKAMWYINREMQRLSKMEWKITKEEKKEKENGKRKKR